MIKLTGKLLLLFFLSILYSCGSNGEEPIQISELPPVSWSQVSEDGQGTLNVLYVPAEGFAYKGEHGELTGFTVALLVDFARFLAEDYNIFLELNFLEIENWTDFYNRIVEGNDGMIGMGNVTITEQRRNELTFSPAYMTNIASLITHIDGDELTAFEEMSSTFGNLNALAFEGTLHEDRLRTLAENYYPDADIELAQSNDMIIDKVSGSNSYFAYIDIYNYWRAVDRGSEIQRHEIGDEAAEQFGYIMPLNTTWEPIITEYFEQYGGLLQTDRYREIMAKHLGEQLTELLLNASPER